MTTATARATHPYLGLGSAAALKKHVLQKNHKLVGRDTVALVREPGDTEGRTYYLLARRASGDMLYLVLPDSKQLCYARVRQERQDMPFLFEVLA